VNVRAWQTVTLRYPLYLDLALGASVLDQHSYGQEKRQASGSKGIQITACLSQRLGVGSLFLGQHYLTLASCPNPCRCLRAESLSPG